MLKKIPFYVLLLPVFFVIHGSLEYYGYLSFSDVLLLMVTYCAGAGVLFGLFFLFCRHAGKAGVYTGAVLFFYFFFGAIKDFLKIHIHFLHRWSVFLPLWIAVAIALFLYLRRKPQVVPRWSLFLNGLFIIYLVIDISGLLIAALWPSTRRETGAATRHLSLTPAADSMDRPDIYFLLFDAYTSSKALREQFHYDNSDLDSFLAVRGFHIQRSSRSNYKYTILSMPSILNMDYLDDLKNVRGGPAEEYLYLSGRIRENVLTAWLKEQGYDIINCSIFDLEGNPTPVSETMLPLKTRLITDQTFYSRFVHDIAWNFLQYFHDPLSKKELYGPLYNNEKLEGLLNEATLSQGKRPRFIYSHFNLPHPPYYFDGKGRKLKVTAPYSPADEDRTEDYLAYVSYANSVLKNMVLTIQQRTNGKAVIIFMGDHGLRSHDRLGYNPLFFLENQNAVYFPSRDYHLLYDSISGVNQFRVVLNTLFRQNIPLLKDSIVNVKDKK
jgi:hypothetical protein